MTKRSKFILNSLGKILGNVVANNCGIPQSAVVVAIEIINKTTIFENIKNTVYDFYTKTENGKSSIKMDRVIVTGTVIGAAIGYIFFNHGSSIKRLIFKAPLASTITAVVPEILSEVSSHTINTVSGIQDCDKQLIPIGIIQSANPAERAIKCMVETGLKEKPYIFSTPHLLMDNLTILIVTELLKENL